MDFISEGEQVMVRVKTVELLCFLGGLVVWGGGRLSSILLRGGAVPSPPRKLK
jgi:hypothetical protein